MKVDVILGLQWGDEGKGKIVDVLTPNYQIVARFQGGPNAGHTLEFENQKYILKSIPSGIFQKEKINIIGNGMVVDPAMFKQEIETLEASGHKLTDRLYISKKAHLILPTHRLLDIASEKEKGDSMIGTTGRGIGPAYTDKIARSGLRIGDIFYNFEEKYRKATERHKQILSRYSFEYDLETLEKEWFAGIEKLKTFNIIDSEHFINKCLNKGDNILAEGAQGSMLDVDFGTYPFVTSSNTVCAGACTGLGVSPHKIGEIFGVFKAYCTRVGSGPFPTELLDNTGKLLRDRGYEYGSVTKRPRRCGWIDLVALRYTIMLNDVTKLVMMKSDVLDTFDTIKACVAYEIDGKETKNLPFDISENIKPM
jgi:adenylosuccinate synthase